MVKCTELDGSIVTYDYDQLRRLSTAVRTGTNPFTQVYAYGSRNNRSSFTDGGVTTTYTYDNANQLISDSGGASYTYDKNGNVKTAGADSFTYDAQNKWTSGTIGGTAMTFTYDGFGRAASRKAGTARTDLWYDQTGLTLESGSLAVTYLRDPTGLLLSANSGTSTYNYGRDRLGSITALTNTGALTLAGENRYDPYGSKLAGSETLPNRFRFTAGYRAAIASGYP